MRRFKTNQRVGSSGIVISIILILIIALFGFLYMSPTFERNAPKIGIANSLYWNLKTPLKLKLSDDTGIKFVRMTLGDGKNSIEIFKKLYTNIKKNRIIDIKFPNSGFVSTKKNFKLLINVTDNSKWNFFAGNSATKTVDIKIDRRRPELYVVDNSYKIVRGGVATVVFKAKDKNLQNLYIKTDFGKKFFPTPFYKPNYFVSLLAWPVEKKKFRATIVATDKAGNITEVPIRLFYVDKKYRISKIKLSDNLLNGKVADLISETKPSLSNASKVKQFKYINENLRNINETIIQKNTTPTDRTMISGFFQKRFYPLKNGKKVASYGDHRYYSYDGKQISEAWHLGIDLASVREANIQTQNSGTVVFANQNGIYGNNLIVYHGLGLYTLYGHSSSFLVNKGDSVKAGQVLARTGTTGLALGDHLHFGVLVQGIEVRPAEWMDRSWMKKNVFNIMKISKKMIDKK